MKKLLVQLPSLLLLTSLSAQPAIEWQKALGGSSIETIASVRPTNDGGYILGGSTYSNDGDASGNKGDADFWVLKLSNIGDIQWQKTLGGSRADFARSVQQTSDGGYILAGITKSADGDVSGSDTTYGDFWVAKISDLGAIQWQKTLGGAEAEDAYAVQQTMDGGFIVAGLTGNTNGHGLFDVWAVKLSENGDLQWQKSIGGTDYDYAYSIRQTSDGGYVLAGYTQSNNGDVSGNHGKADCWVVKLNNTGDLQWQKTLGGSQDEFAFDIHQTNDGGFAVAGFTFSNDGDVTGNHGATDFWVLKLSDVGDIQWQKALGGSSGDIAYAIDQTADGGYIITGSTYSLDGDVTEPLNGSGDAWVVKLNSAGQIQSQKTLGGSEYDVLFSIQQTNEGGYVIAGQTGSNDGDVSGFHGGFTDAWIVKLYPESVGMKDLRIQPGSLEIFPNPASSMVSLGISAEEPFFDLVISDLLGRKISQQAAVNGRLVDVSTLDKGLYLLTATTSSGKVYSGKLSKCK